jgi:hypothetical protein
MAKGNVKDPASHTQRITSTLSYQTGKRYIESLTFREYKRLKAEETNGLVDCYDYGGYINRNTPEAQAARTNTEDNVYDTGNQRSSSSAGTSFTLVLHPDQRDNEYVVDVCWKGKGIPTLGQFDKHLLSQVGKRLFGADDGGVILDNEVQGCTSVIVQGTTYTAHPLFRNDHPWHDWVYIHWEGYDDPIPARIDMFLDLRQSTISNVTVDGEDNETEADRHEPIPFRHMFLEKKLYAVVWSAKSLQFPRNRSTEHHIPLKLGFRVELEDYRRIVDVDSFVRPCFGLLNTCGISRAPFDRTAIIMKDREDWVQFFLSD